MKKTIITGALAFALGAAAIVLVLADPLHWSWMGRARARLSGLAASPAPAHPAQRTIKYWRAPMDPTYIRDKPGKSPMGMDLIPVYEDDAGASAPGIVHIDPGFVQNIGVQSAPVTRTDIPFTIRTVATLTYDDSQAVLVNTKYRRVDRESLRELRRRAGATGTEAV